MSQKKQTDYFDQFNDASDPATDESEKKSSGSEDFARLLGESFAKKAKRPSVGDKVQGKILVIGRDEVFVSIGAQTEGAFPKRDILDSEGQLTAQVGDTVQLYVTQVRGDEIRLSKNPTDRNIAEDLEDAFDMMLPISGRVVEVCKGGVRVNLKGKLAFCPISQIDVKHVDKPEEYVGKSFDFRITQFTEGGKNIVVSRRKLLEEERELGLVTFLEEHKDGDTVQGRVARLEKFGAFVELAPGVDGLVHISEIAWSRIGDPSEVLQVGQPVSVKILKRETINDRMKISLSIKQAMAKEEIAAAAAAKAATAPGAKYSVGQIVEGKVTRKEVYGVFVQLEPGVTGLLHQSRTHDAPEFRLENVKVGDSLTVEIAEIKRDTQQISLGLPRDPNADDWKKHTGTAANASFGTLADKMKAALSVKKK